jgi:predicted amidophosphoribosyltransferase
MAWLLDLVFPTRCAACGGAADVLCGGCRSRLRRPGPPSCGRCGAPTVWPVPRCRECSGRRLAFTSARAAVVYAGPARPFVAAWKEHGLRRAADLAAELVVDALPPPAADVIAYIPPDPGRLLRRGHHPARELACRLGAAWRIDEASLLCVPSGTPTRRRQAGLTRRDRLNNAQTAFEATAASPARVLLVDDVYTTGATVAAAAAVLRRAGATNVDVVTFARTPRV